MASYKVIVLFAAIAAALQCVTPAIAGSIAEQVSCIGTKSIGDTVGIVSDRKTGAREQSLVEARLGVVSHGAVLGTVYIDDQGMRYLEVKRGAVIAGVAGAKGDGTVQPLGAQEVFGGEARLRACRPDIR